MSPPHPLWLRLRLWLSAYRLRPEWLQLVPGLDAPLACNLHSGRQHSPGLVYLRPEVDDPDLPGERYNGGDEPRWRSR